MHSHQAMTLSQQNPLSPRTTIRLPRLAVAQNQQASRGRALGQGLTSQDSDVERPEVRVQHGEDSFVGDECNWFLRRSRKLVLEGYIAFKL